MEVEAAAREAIAYGVERSIRIPSVNTGRLRIPVELNDFDGGRV